MQTILFHPDPALCRELERMTRRMEWVTVLCARYEELATSGLAREGACVAAGNGFGIMDGGLDLSMKRAHGAALEWSVRAAIIEAYGPELPVGAAVLAHAPDGQTVIYAPTMQGPMLIRGTDNVYRAARAAAHAAQRYGLTTLFMPLLGCGTGGMDPGEAVSQILAGVRDATRCMGPEGMTWAHANRMHRQWHRMCGIADDGFCWVGGDYGESVDDPEDG